MKLYEFEAMELFKKYEIPILDGIVIERPEGIIAINSPVVLKSQILSGGRGKAGGIKFAKNLEEARNGAKELLSMEIKGYKVRKILITERIGIKKEYYLGFTIDRSSRNIVLMFSTEGGVDIEEVSRKNPDSIWEYRIDGHNLDENKLKVLSELDNKLDVDELISITKKLYKFFVDSDAELAEINPLALTDKGLVALDAKVIIDDNALFRHPEFIKLRSDKVDEEHTEAERIASEQGFAYVELGGNIAVIGCGAGLVMATLDLIELYGGKPACFLDLGGGASTERMRNGLDIVLMNPKVKCVLINAFCGITRCDDLANGIINYNVKIPLSIRLTGTNENLGIEILRKKGFNVFDFMDDAIKKAVEISK